MAGRNEARIFVSIWKDAQFRALGAGAQRLFMFLLSQPDLSFCGVVPLRARRWAKAAKDLTADEIERDLKALSEPFAEPFAEADSEGSGGPPLVVDEETEEVFVRSLIRLDGIWRQPNIMKAAMKAAEDVESPLILAVMLIELHRLPIHEEGVTSNVRGTVEAFIRQVGNQLSEASGIPPLNPSAKGSLNPSPTPSPSPLTPETPFTSEPASQPSDPPKGAEDPGEPEEPEGPEDKPDIVREDVERLCIHLADRVEQNTERRPAITKKWRDAARLLLDRDKRTEEQIHTAIDWCQNDKFWRSNILSMPKLRTQYDQLRLQAMRGPSPASRPGFAPGTGATAPVASSEDLTNLTVEKLFGRTKNA